MRISKPLVMLAAFAALALPAKAEDAWPQRPVTVIVPFGPGGTTDLFARLVADKLQATFKQPFVVENRPGAGGNIGTALVAKSEPDGHTLLVATVSTHAINPFLYKKLSYDTLKDFAPVTQLVRLPNMLVVNPKVPAKTVPELIAYLKSNPDKLTYGSSGAGTSQHLSGELFKMMTGTTMTHVPFRSSGEIMTALLGGHVDLAFDNMPVAWPHAKAGKVNALAVTSPDRNAAAPDVPPVADTLKGFDATSWNGLLTRAGTPKPILDKLAAEVKRILDEPDVKAKIAEVGAVAFASTPEEFAAFIDVERKKWEEVVRVSGAEVE